MNIAKILYIACYIPELYANYKNKNANIYNLPEKVVVFVGTAFAFAYSVVTENQSLVLNYGPILALDTSAMLMRAYYVYQTHRRGVVAAEEPQSQSQSQPSSRPDEPSSRGPSRSDATDSPEEI